MGLDRGGLVDREVNSVVGWEESVQLEGSTLKKAKSFNPVVESSREVVDTSPGGAGVVKEEFMSGSMGGVVRLGEAAVESREPGGLVREEGGPVVESSGGFLGSERNWSGKNLSHCPRSLCDKWIHVPHRNIYISRKVIQICFR